MCLVFDLKQWWASLGFAVLEAIIVSCYSLQYSIYAVSQRLKHVMITSFLLVIGAMSMTWISDTISESGFGHGSSLIICAGILTGYTETLFKMFSFFRQHSKLLALLSCSDWNIHCCDNVGRANY